MPTITRNTYLSYEERKSLNYTDSGHSEDLRFGMYPHMLFEDIHNSVLPLSQHYSKRKNYSILLNPPDRNLEEILITIFVSRDGYREHNLTDAIGGFISDNAGLLAHWGFVDYEINPTIEIDKKGSRDPHVESFRLLRIPGKILKLGNVVIQLIPKRYWTERKQLFISFPSKSVWILTIPSILGGIKKHRQMMKSLRFSGLTVPEFVTNRMSQYIENNEFTQNLGLPEFSFSEFHQIQKLAIATESSLWGWPIRNLLREETLEFYQIYRQIKFSQTLGILREYILARINDLIEQKLSTSKLCFNDLPSYSDLRKIESDLIEGKISLEDAYSSIQL